MALYPLSLHSLQWLRPWRVGHLKLSLCSLSLPPRPVKDKYKVMWPIANQTSSFQGGREREGGTHHSRHHLSKNNMAAIKPGCLDSGDEELRPIGVLARVGHTQPTRLKVLQLEVLVWKLAAIDALACWEINKSSQKFKKWSTRLLSGSHFC